MYISLLVSFVFSLRKNAKRHTNAERERELRLHNLQMQARQAGPNLRHESGYEHSALNSHRRHASVPTTQYANLSSEVFR